MAKIFTKRLMKELRDLQDNPPAGVVLEDVDDLKWYILRIYMLYLYLLLYFYYY